MCDFDGVRNWLIAAGVSITGAATFAGLALAAIVFVWTWWLVPVFSASAGASLTMAVLSVTFARNQAFEYYGCMVDGTPTVDSPCWGAWLNFSNAAFASIATLSILAAIALAYAASFLTPWSGPDLGWLIGGIVASGIAITTLLIFLVQFRTCLEGRG